MVANPLLQVTYTGVYQAGHWLGQVRSWRKGYGESGGSFWRAHCGEEGGCAASGGGFPLYKCLTGVG